MRIVVKITHLNINYNKICGNYTSSPYAYTMYSMEFEMLLSKALRLFCNIPVLDLVSVSEFSFKQVD
jgi:hypothetical protein